ncbi:MAG: hypothetical protein LBD88_02025 [Candidatus Peribacteria bacterium]|jgi:hypothetical protein|nr:hypothetical protein [Candidatus Peribacteria bacterium]
MAKFLSLNNKKNQNLKLGESLSFPSSLEELRKRPLTDDDRIISKNLQKEAGRYIRSNGKKFGGNEIGAQNFISSINAQELTSNDSITSTTPADFDNIGNNY